MRGLLATLLLAGCSLVNDPNAHLVGGADGSGLDAEASDGGGGDAGTDDGGPSDAGPPPVAFEEVCPALAAEFCDARMRCCRRDAGMAGDCLAETEATCSMLYGRAVADSRIRHDDAAAGVAVARGRAMAEACDPAIAEFMYQANGLYAGLVGTVAGGARCDPAEATIPEYFVSTLSCASDTQVCHVLDAMPACLDLIDDGGPCRLGPECRSGRCVGAGPSAAVDGTCGPGRAPGMGCDWPWDCASYVCRGTCQPQTADDVYCPAD